jgi:hypothetical protein
MKVLLQNAIELMNAGMNAQIYFAQREQSPREANQVEEEVNFCFLFFLRRSRFLSVVVRSSLASGGARP